MENSFIQTTVTKYMYNVHRHDPYYLPALRNFVCARWRAENLALNTSEQELNCIFAKLYKFSARFVGNRDAVNIYLGFYINYEVGHVQLCSCLHCHFDRSDFT